MELYRGDAKPDFEVKPWIRSRYSISALFFTPDIDLARLYAIHHAKEYRSIHKGSVYMCEINNMWLFTHDFQGKSSYSAEFRNLIHTFHQFRHKAALIKNVLDYPSKDLIRYQTADIVVVFDFDIIESLKQVQTNIWSQ